MKRHLQIVFVFELIFFSERVFAQCAGFSGEITGGTTICNGDSTNLTVTFTAGTSPFTFTYNDGTLHTINNITSPYTLKTGALTATKTFTLTNVTDSNNCTGSITGVAQTVTVLNPVDFGTLASNDQEFCTSGDPSNIIFSTAPSGGSGTFTFQWYRLDDVSGSCPTGTDVTGWTIITGATNSNYNPTSISTSRTYAVQVNATGSPDCGVATWATGCRKVTVGSSITPSVSITAFPGNTICTETEVAIVATASNTGGGSVNYNFKVNNVSKQNGSSTVYLTSSLVNGNSIICDITITGGECLSSSTATSNIISMTVAAQQTPSVSISALPGSSVCVGDPVTVVATALNTGGGSVNYNFKVNNVSQQNESSNVFVTSSLQNGNTITCDITVTGGTCLSATEATSNTITMTVNPNLTPSVSISALNNPICQGSKAKFTANASNTGGGSVSYNFKVNNISQQESTSKIYKTTSLENNDVVICEITVTGGTCLTSPTASSNIILMSVNSSLTPSVSISASPGSTICTGANVTFTATPINTAGGVVTYNFKVNNISQQIDTFNVFSTSSLTNAATVTCEITIPDTGSSTCLSDTMALSNSISMTVNPNTTPSVMITASPNDTICGGSNVIFTATADSTGGGSIIYNFWVNNDLVQTGDSNSYHTTTLANNDVVSCDVTISNGTCLSALTASSDILPMTINQNITPSVSLLALPNDTVCAGTNVTFTATTINNGGGSVNYDFKVNGDTKQNGASNAYSTTALNNDDTVTCKITVSNGTCLTTDTVNSVPILITVHPIPIINPVSDTTFCNGTTTNGISFSTSNTDSAITLYDWSCTANFGFGTTGIGFIPAFAASNNDAFPKTDTIYVIPEANSCIGSTLSFTITINPSPKLSGDTVKTICDNELLSYTATSVTPGVAYRWKRGSIPGISNSADSASTNLISETLHNTTDTSIAVIYEFVLTTPDSLCSNICLLKVIVNPSPKVDFISNKVYCSGESIGGISFSSQTTSSTYSWKCNPDIGFGTAGDGFIPNTVVSNTGDVPLPAIINVQATANGCVGPQTTFIVTVNPRPTLTSATAISICSGNMLNYAITSFVSEVQYSWSSDTSLAFVSGNSSHEQSDTNLIPDLLIDLLNDLSVPVKYDIILVYTDTAGNTCKTDTSINVTVNPSPLLPLFSTIDTLTVCGGSQNVSFNVDPLFINTGETFLWSVTPATGANIRNFTNPNTVISFGNTPDTVEIRVIAYNSSSVGSCPDSSSQIVIIFPSNDSISERSIILKQPGNLLVYPDNSLDSAGYQWGYDEMTYIGNDTILGAPQSISGQVYQVFIPDSKFLSGEELNTTEYAFWVSLIRGSCNSKVYYNGPYAHKKLEENPSPDPAVAVTVFPNPSSGSFDFTLQGKIYGELTSTLYNTLGEAAYQNTFLKKNYEITQRIPDVHLPDGIYLLELVSSDHQKLVTRIVISH